MIFIDFISGEKTKITQLQIKSLEFENKPSYYVKAKNYSATVTCSVYVYGGSPEHIQGRWYKLDERNYNVNYTVITSNNTVLVKANILKGGKYICEVRNKMEKIEAFTIIEFDKIELKGK